LDAVLQAAGQDAQPHDQQDIAHDGSDQRSLHQIEQTCFDSEERDDQFGGVAQGGIKQAAQAWPGFFSQRFRRCAHEAR
jgi:hypothetical protein